MSSVILLNHISFLPRVQSYELKTNQSLFPTHLAASASPGLSVSPSGLGGSEPGPVQQRRLSETFAAFPMVFHALMLTVQVHEAMQVYLCVRYVGEGPVAFLRACAFVWVFIVYLLA